MHTENTVIIRADLATVYDLAAAVQRWPVILPHYRWVRVLEDHGDRRVVEMAAHRDGVPLWWCAEQVLDPAARRIMFRHVRGITTGMAVEWSFLPDANGVRVSIRHDLRLAWPIVGGLVANCIIGPLFVSNIAGKTLRRIKLLAERTDGPHHL